MVRFAVIVMVLLLCASCSSQVSSNDQFTGPELKFKSFLIFGLQLSAKAIDKLSPEQLADIYKTFADKVAELPPDSFNQWFHQTQGQESQLSADVKNELRAIVAKELQEAMKDNTGGP